MPTQGLRPGLFRSIALTGLIYVFSINILYNFDTLALHISAHRVGLYKKNKKSRAPKGVDSFRPKTNHIKRLHYNLSHSAPLLVIACCDNSAGYEYKTNRTLRLNLLELEKSLYFAL